MAGIVEMLCLLSMLFLSTEVRAQARPYSQEPFMAFRTNILYDAFVVPNIGVEVALPMRFTIGFDWLGNWISSDKHHLAWQGYGGYLTLRYYFGKVAAYTFGLPFTSVVTMNPSTGAITAELYEKASSGVGFYVNANPNKEESDLQSLWLRNNRYVLHNKIYYRAGSSGAHAPEHADVQFVPVDFNFDIEEEPEEEQPGDNNQTRIGDGCAYDILGRKVATEAEVKNGTCYQHLQPGVYIVDGQKIYVGCL